MGLDPRAIRSFVEEHRDSFIKQLSDFCSIPSVTRDRDAALRAHEFLASYMRKLDVDVQSVQTQGNPVLFGRSGSPSPATIGYYSHYDVVPSGDVSAWETPPFSVGEREGRLFGRGVADHKGWLLSRLQGLEVLRALDGSIEPKVEYVFEGDEEEGSSPLEALVKSGQLPLSSGIVLYSGWQRSADGTPRINGGGRGVLQVRVTVKNADTDLHGSYAPLVTNPLSYLTDLMSEVIAPDGRVRIPGFYDDAHAPSDEDLEALERVPFSFSSEQKRLGFIEANGLTSQSTRREVLTQHYFTPVAYATEYATSGVAGTVVPREASVQLRFSLVPDQDPGELFERVQNFLRERSTLPVSMDVTRVIPPARTQLSSPGFDIIRAACRAWYGEDPVTIPFSSGSGPRHLFIHHLDKDMIVDVGVSDVHSLDHSPNESIRVDHYLDGIVHGAHTLLEAAKVVV